jgi:hypothetical protein
MRLALAVALVLVLPACGGAEREANLEEALAKTEEAGSARFELHGSEQEGAHAQNVSCHGEADYRRTRLHVTCEFDDFGTLEMISVGKTTYTRGTAASPFELPADTWTKSDDDEADADELSPQRLLKSLRDASQGTERIGDETVRAVETVRYRLDVDCQSADLELGCEGVVPVDVWVGDDGIVRRIAYDASTESATFELYDFGAPVDIEAPPAGSVRIPDDPLSRRPCRSGGSPISGGRLLAALRNHGFTAEQAERCPEIAAALLSGHVTGNPVGPVVVTCFVLEDSPPDASATTDITDAPGGESLQLQNLQCTTYTTTAGAAADAALRRLEDAFRSLER